MAVTKEEIESFHRFAEMKIQSGEEDLTMEELFDLWRLENPSPEQSHEDLLAVKAALRDLENGDRGVPFEEHVREVEAKFNITPSE